MPTTYEVIIGILAFSYLMQSWYIGKLLRLKTQMAKEHTHLLLSTAEHQLAEAMLKQSIASLEAQKELIESVKILSDRVASYNERLNNLTMSVKLDRSSKHM